MKAALCRWCAGLLLACLMTGPALAAEDKPSSPGAKPATPNAEPAVPDAERALPELMPEGTLLYIGWPGCEVLAETSRDTALGKLAAEPEVARVIEAWGEKIWPALDKLIRHETRVKTETDEQAYAASLALLDALWRYPVAVGLIGVSMGEKSPQVDAMLVVRAGEKAGQLADGLEKIFADKGIAVKPPTEAKVGGLTLKEMRIPDLPMPLRWGALGGDFVVTIGPKAAEHLAAGAGRKTLGQSERFTKAMEVTGGTASTPMLYIDLKGVIKTLEAFQPMFGGFELPILGEEGGVQRLLGGLGFGKVESLSMAMVPEANGFKTTVFLHAPGLGEGASAMLIQKPLLENDLAVVPRDASWAVVVNFDLVKCYKGIMNSFHDLAPEMYEEVFGAVESFENKLGMTIAEGVLGTFGDTWAIFDAPSQGGIWITGITLVAEVSSDNRLETAIEAITALIAGAADAGDTVTLRHEDYRGQRITFLNVSGIPLPVAPAWAQFEGRWILALYPQMVRATLDRLMDKGESLSDNSDFQRGRRLMPEGPSSITYVDTAAGIRQLYPYALPLGQMLMAMAQGEEIPIDVTMIPTLPVLTRHVFGYVSATAATKDGVVSVSHGPSPLQIPAMGGGGMEIPLLASIGLPSLAKAREQARHTASMANLHAIAVACLMYANDNKGEFPPDLETLTKDNSKACLSPQQLISPTDESGSQISYVYVAGQKLTHDPRNVLAYERPEITDGKWINVAFLDGHARRMKMDEFERALRETNDRLGEKKSANEKGQ